MKVFVASHAHETSSFSPIPTSRTSFEPGYFHPTRETPIETALQRGKGSAYGEWVRLSIEKGYEIALGPAGGAGPSGRTVKADYEALRDEILDRLRESMPVDMALLFLHGSQMAVGYDDCEGDLLARARAIVGPNVPIGVELDLHCNITPPMLEHATIILACKEYPHTDFADRARDLFALVDDAANGRTRPVMSFCRVPMLNLFFTTVEPMRSFVDKTAALEGKDDVLSVTLAHGFTSADMAHTSASVIVVTDGARDKGDTLARELGREFFALREIAGPKTLSIDAALDAALAVNDIKPVVVADGADNPGGGAAGDSTFILRRMLERGVQDAGFAMIWDPVAVQLATDAGVGATLPLRIGGKTGPMSGDPLDVIATVLGAAQNVMQIGFSGRQDLRIGDAVAIRVDGIDIILNTRRVQTFSPEVFTELGVDPFGKRMLIVKSNQHFYARFAPHASKVLYCEAPGTTGNDVTCRKYTKLPRPIWPLDDVTL